MSHSFFGFLNVFFPWFTFARIGMQRAASANVPTKGAGSGNGACDAFEVDD